MNFSSSDRAEAFRAEVRAFLADHVDDEMKARVEATGTQHDWGLHRAMAERGWIAAAWPEAYGGRGWGPWEMNVLEEELFLAGAPRDGMSLTMTATNAIRHVGSEAQQQLVIPRVLGGEILLSLGWSEPDAGSDVAAAKTRAVRDGDEWIVNGQKMFTTMAHIASYVFLLARTNSEVPKHQGLTMFLVDTAAPGFEVQPVHTLGGERTNVTFYTDVRVPDSMRIGEVDGGWDVMRVGLSYEHGTNWGAQLARLVQQAGAWAASTGRIDEPAVAERLARAATDAEVGMLLGQHSAWVAESGRISDVEASMAKLFSSEALVRAAGQLVDVVGPEALLRAGQPGAVADGDLEHTFRQSVVRTIYAGSSEMQRNIVGQRGLGLPRP
ncbi:MAG: acyl-CoA dehydrogenase family protein [Acidimicrobiia bacterium]